MCAHASVWLAVAARSAKEAHTCTCTFLWRAHLNNVPADVARLENDEKRILRFMQEQLKNYFTFNYPHYSNNHFNRMNLTAEELHTFDRSAILKKYSRMSLCSVVYTLWNMAQEFVTVLVCHFGIGVARVWSLESTLECSSMYTSKLRLAPSHLLLIQLSIMIQEYGKICDTSTCKTKSAVLHSS